MDRKLILIIIFILFIFSDCKEVCRLKNFNGKKKEEFTFNEYNTFQSMDQDKYDICKYADSLKTCKNFIQQMGPNVNLARIGSILNVNSSNNKFFPIYSYYDRRLEKNRYLIKDYVSSSKYIWRHSDNLPEHAEEGAFVDLGNNIKGRFVRKEGDREYQKIGYIEKTDGTRFDLYENQNYYDPRRFKYFVAYNDAIVVIHNKRKLKDGDIVTQMTLGKIAIVRTKDEMEKNTRLKMLAAMDNKIKKQEDETKNKDELPHIKDVSKDKIPNDHILGDRSNEKYHKPKNNEDHNIENINEDKTWALDKYFPVV